MALDEPQTTGVLSRSEASSRLAQIARVGAIPAFCRHRERSTFVDLTANNATRMEYRSNLTRSA